MIELRNVNITLKSPPYFQEDEISLEIDELFPWTWTGWGPCKEEILERKKKDEQCVCFTCVHTYVSIYLCANTQTPCVVYACVYIFIFIHICMYRVHRALPNKYTPDVLILSAPKKIIIEKEMKQSFWGHWSYYQVYWFLEGRFYVVHMFILGKSRHRAT